MEIELLGYRPTGTTPSSSKIVKIAAETNRALGLPSINLTAASTDSNIPMNLGIPAITISGGGVGTGPHTLHEAIDMKDAWIGTQRDFLLVVALVNVGAYNNNATKR